MRDPEDPHPDRATMDQSPADLARVLAQRAPFTPGNTVPNREMWVLERLLGGGGFGEVWLARHEWKDERVAVKFCTHPASRHQLVTHEKVVVARVMKHCGDHPHVVPLLDCNLSGETPWLIYEYVPGGTLAAAAGDWRGLPLAARVATAAGVLRALARTLAEFHRLDPPIVHRDLKPHNVLMCGGVPRITDFGLGGAALTGARADVGGSAALPSMLRAAGTLRYAPPEQLLGAPPSPRDDVYALGVTAYQLLLGDLEATPDSGAVATLLEAGVSGELAGLVADSVALDPDRRPEDAGEWCARLPEPTAEPDHVPTALPLPSRRRQVSDARDNAAVPRVEGLRRAMIRPALYARVKDGSRYPIPLYRPKGETTTYAVLPDEPAELVKALAADKLYLEIELAHSGKLPAGRTVTAPDSKDPKRVGHYEVDKLVTDTGRVYPVAVSIDGRGTIAETVVDYKTKQARSGFVYQEPTLLRKWILVPPGSRVDTDKEGNAVAAKADGVGNSEVKIIGYQVSDNQANVFVLRSPAEGPAAKMGVVSSTGLVRITAFVGRMKGDKPMGYVASMGPGELTKVGVDGGTVVKNEVKVVKAPHYAEAVEEHIIQLCTKKQHDPDKEGLKPYLPVVGK